MAYPAALVLDTTFMTPHSLPVISLVTATAGTRAAELRRMLDSVRAQTEHNFEVIVVDQSDGALDALLREYPEVIHVRSNRMGLSRNRNIGIARSSGSLLAFPDDDCVLPREYISEINRISGQICGDTLFAFGNGLQIEDRKPFNYLYKIGSIRRLTASNCYLIPSWALVFERSALDRVGGFDEDFGVGATYGAAEEVDIMLRLIDLGIHAIYAPHLEVLHPSRAKWLVSLPVHRSYSEATGALARKTWQTSRNWRFLLFFIYTTARSFGGTIIATLQGDPMNRVYAANFLAKIRGFLIYKGQRARRVSPRHGPHQEPESA